MTYTNKFKIIVYSCIIFFGMETEPYASTNNYIPSVNTTLDYIDSKKPVIDSNISAIKNKHDKAEIMCLALNMYHETRGTTPESKLAVGLVTLNRTNDPRYPNSICNVVFQHVTKNTGKSKSTIYQFSWLAKKRENLVPREIKEWVESQRLAYFLYYNKEKFVDFTDGSTHFYAPKVLAAQGIPTPKWASAGEKTMELGGHVYIRIQ